MKIIYYLIVLSQIIYYRGSSYSMSAILWNPLTILQLNRNARVPKPANHGSRPCSSVMRRLKKRQYYKRWSQKTPPDLDQLGK